MDPQLIGWLGIAAVFALLILRVPIAYVLVLVGFLGYTAIRGLDPALRIAAMIPYAKIASYPFSVIPLFIIMGHFAYIAGFANGLFRATQAWFGRVPGGLVQATIAGSAAFGAASGSGLATCAIVSKVAIPQMIELGVNRKLAYGAVAAAGTIAQMIPPSILMVIYGIITETSVAKLLIAGILPGIVAAINYMIMVYIRAKRNPSLAPLAKGVSWKESFIALKDTWGIAVLAVLVIGGIYSGIFTPTEAGAVGAAGAFILALALKKLKWKDLSEVLVGTSRTTGMVFLIIACAFVLGYFLGISRLPTQVSLFLTELAVPRLFILLGIMVMYIILGFFLDMIAAMFLTLPIIMPAIVNLGYDPIWFGVIMVHLCEVALITPPFGLNLFVMKGVLPDANLREIIAGIWPFFLVDMITLAIYIAFPQLSLFLPQMMG